MGEDEAGTRARFNSRLNSLIKPAIESRQGRIVKTLGDGLLVEFASVVDAVECAIAIQEGMATRNDSVSGGIRIELRIGINLGDVVIDGDDLYGDGVNIAARLEGIADPGGICISAEAQRQVAGKIARPLQDMGEQVLKNIAQPVHCYRVCPQDNDSPAQPYDPQLVIPDRPSIAVMPFASTDDSRDESYFSDGITDDLITDLSKISGLFVISRNSTFRYRDQVIDARDVSRALGIRYVLEGNVRRSGNQIRINS